MELFISQNTKESKLSLAVELFTNYVRAAQRKAVNVVALAKSTQQSLKLHELPVLIKPVSGTKREDGTVDEDENVHTVNPFGIMQEIARSVYLDEVLLGKFDSPQRLEVMSFIELALRKSPEELAQLLNAHLELKMFIVGHSVTGADILTLAHISDYFVGLQDYEKIQLPHVFRWLDHVQHLPGLLEQVQQRGLFVSFPDENAQGPSKAQLKKGKKGGDMSNPKFLAAQAAKAEKKGGAATVPVEEQKNGEQKPPVQQEAIPVPTEAPAEAKPAKQKQQQNPPKKAAPAKKAEDGPQIPDISQMDIRVGRIIEVWKNPGSENLYNEKIDIGNGEIRCVASGLQKFVPIEHMQNALCIVLCNLKARKLADYMSHGMVLCAETPDKSVVELLAPPEGSQAGDLVTFAGLERNPPAELNPKKNPWDTVQPKLSLNAEGVACWDNIPFTTDKGIVKSKTIVNGIIH